VLSVWLFICVAEVTYSAQEFSETVIPVVLQLLPAVGIADYCTFGECSVCSALLSAFQDMCQIFLSFPQWFISVFIRL